MQRPPTSYPLQFFVTLALAGAIAAPDFALAAGPSSRGQARNRPVIAASKPKPRLNLKHIRHLVIDPGHGGSNKGAVGYHAGREKQLTLEISRVLKRYIESRSNVRVTLTRHADVDLALRHRPRLANKIGGDALISVHCNASVKSTVRGMEVWFLTADSSMRVIHDIVRREEGVPDAGPEVARQWTAQGVVETLRHAQAHRASQA
ncbi:MAG: N-acetylmuramoyl-L-alanine amidase, partial [Myxococcales bacterium]|nr:N-acetylmuramoyl-L-alanine amidase [Myxococcales bacterium]